MRLYKHFLKLDRDENIHKSGGFNWPRYNVTCKNNATLIKWLWFRELTIFIGRISALKDSFGQFQSLIFNKFIQIWNIILTWVSTRRFLRAQKKLINKKLHFFRIFIFLMLHKNKLQLIQRESCFYISSRHLWFSSYFVKEPYSVN